MMIGGEMNKHDYSVLRFYFCLELFFQNVVTIHGNYKRVATADKLF